MEGHASCVAHEPRLYGMRPYPSTQPSHPHPPKTCTQAANNSLHTCIPPRQLRLLYLKRLQPQLACCASCLPPPESAMLLRTIHRVSSGNASQHCRQRPPTYGTSHGCVVQYVQGHSLISPPSNISAGLCLHCYLSACANGSARKALTKWQTSLSQHPSPCQEGALKGSQRNHRNDFILTVLAALLLL